MQEARADARGWAKERLLRQLLDPVHGIHDGKSLYQIAKETNVSYSWAHHTLGDLVRLGAVQKVSRGHRVAHPEKAFAYWLEHRPERLYRDYHVLAALDFLKSIKHDKTLQYVATTYLAENLVQGHLFPRRFDLYINPGQAQAWHAALSSRGFPIDTTDPGRGTVRLITVGAPGDEETDMIEEVSLPPQGLNWNPRRDIWIARPALLIVDLLEEGGPCIEAAEKLMEKSYA